MIGALVGYHGLSPYMVKKLITFDCMDPNNNEKRPEHLSVKRVGIVNIERLI
jgi:hypothetical protein